MKGGFDCFSPNGTRVEFLNYVRNALMVGVKKRDALFVIIFQQT